MKNFHLPLLLLLFSITYVIQAQETQTDKAEKAQRLTFEAVELIKKETPADVRLSIPKLEEAAKLFNELSDQTSENFCVFMLGNAYRSLKEKRKALEYLERSLAVFVKLGEKQFEMSNQMLIATVYDDLEETQKAIEHYERVLSMSRETKDKLIIASTLLRIGRFYSSIEQHEKAITYLSEDLQLFTDLGQANAQVAILKTLGEEHNDLGEPEMALKCFNSALPIARVSNDKPGEIAILHDLGSTFLDLGEYDTSLKYYTDALTVAKVSGNKKAEASILVNIGSILFSEDKFREALELGNKALAIFKEIGDEYGEGATLGTIGILYSSLGEKQKALDFFNQALPIRKAGGDLDGEASTLAAIGTTYADLNNIQMATEYYLKAIPIARRVKDRSLEARILTNLAAGYSQAKNSRFETVLAKKAINIEQQLRRAIRGLDTETQKSYLRRVRVPYNYLMGNLLSQNRLTEMIQVLNMAGDQQTFDIVADNTERSKSLTYTLREEKFSALYNAAADKVGNLGDLIAKLKREIGPRSPSQQETQELQRLDSQLRISGDEFIQFIRHAADEFAGEPDKNDSSPDIKDLEEIQNALRRLEAQTGKKPVIIYTVIGIEKFFEIIITRDKISSVSTVIKGKDLDEKAKDFADNIKALDYRNKPKIDVTDQAKELYNLMFKPVEAELPPGTNTIMWLLDSNLRYIPIAALHDGKDYLIRRNINNVVFTRADPERLTRPLHPAWRATILANSAAKKSVMNLGISYDFPELVAVDSEVKSIVKQKQSSEGILEGDIFANQDFTRNAMLAALRKKNPIVHISSHFSIKSGDIARSFLLLGDGTAFSLLDMRGENNLFGGVDLLTLSACNTAIDEQSSDGREVDGFAEIAQRLGAASVLATLWSVNECSTAEFMKLFYKNKITDKMTKAEALRKAQLALYEGGVRLPDATCKTTKTNENPPSAAPVSTKEFKAFKENPVKPFEHPYYWSPFVLYGNWQ